MERNGFPRKTFFTYSYSPIPGDDGGVGGVFCACTEETQRVLGRTAASAAPRARGTSGRGQVDRDEPARSPPPRWPRTRTTSLSRCSICSSRMERRARLAGSSGLVPAHPASPSTVELGGDGDRWQFARVAATGEAVLVDGLAARFGRLPGGVWPESPSHAIVLPMLKASQSARPAGFVVAGISPRLPFDDDYRGFLGLVAGQIGDGRRERPGVRGGAAPRRGAGPSWTRRRPPSSRTSATSSARR